MINASTIATIISTAAFAIAGWFGVTISSLQSQVSANDTANAKIQQQVNDIDFRTTRIENKLDSIIGGRSALRNI